MLSRNLVDNERCSENSDG